MATAITTTAHSKKLPAPTPQVAASLSQQQLEDHRRAIAFDVEVILDGYWDRMPPADVKAGILADWADTLEDWTQEQVLYGLRKWRNENPNRKPNPGHVLAVLKDLRGRREVERAALSKQATEETKPEQTPEERKASQERVAAMVAELGAGKRMGGK